MPFHEIPVIDFAALLGTDTAARHEVRSEPESRRHAKSAFSTQKSGVPQAIISNLFAQGPAFFALPLAEKMRVL